ATKLEPKGTAFPMPQSRRPERKAIRPVLMIKLDFIANPYVNAISPTNMTGGTQRMSQMNVSDRRLFMAYRGLTGENIQGSPEVGGRTTEDAPHPDPLPVGQGEGGVPGTLLPRVALVPHLPWATIMSSLRDFRLCEEGTGGGKEKVEGVV